MNITITIVLIVVFVLMLVMPYFTQKKRNQEYMNMLSNIKVGDMVKTAGGIIGKVNKITDKGEVKTIVLETGSKSQKSYLEMDMTMIYCVLNKTTAKPETEEAQKEEVVEANAEEVAKENAEEQPLAEPAAKEKKPKTAAKKTTKTSTKSKSTKTSK